MNKPAEQLYKEREKRVNDAVQLKEPDRVPIVGMFGFFPAKYAGITSEEAMYWFESTDMFKAKEIVGDVACIRGNVPLSILSTGTPEDVRDYCKRLINHVGRGGGFIMDASTQFDDAKPENVKTMFAFTKEYGQYG